MHSTRSNEKDSIKHNPSQARNITKRHIIVAHPKNSRIECNLFWSWLKLKGEYCFHKSIKGGIRKNNPKMGPSKGK
jgi:hypothetical protein